jgi:hypothetical protein
VDWDTQNWSRGYLKNGFFSCGPPSVGLDGRGKVPQLHFQKGKSTFCWGEGDCLHFATGRSNSIAPPGCQLGQYDNQMKDGGVRAETAGDRVAATLFEGI